MVVLTLPLSFTNSFWTPDYRKGLEVLFTKLEQGVVENDEIVAFIRARAVAETQLAISLTDPVPIGQKGTGFSADDGASLLMAFRGLQAESIAQGEAHKSVAKELHTLVADPFEGWAHGYRERLKQSKIGVMDNWLRSYEQAQAEVAKLKSQYLAKNRRADEAEDDAKFAPNNDYGDKYTSSPRLAPHDRAPPQRTPSVSERIAQRLREIQNKATSAASAQEPPKPDETVFEAGSENEKSPPPPPPPLPKVDKGKGKAKEVEEPESVIVASPPPLSPALPPPAQLTAEPTALAPPPPTSPPPFLLAGLSMSSSSLSALLKRASTELPLRPVRVPLFGEYQDCFTGDDFVAWLNVNVPGFGGNLDTAEDAARELTERYGLLRRIGELGNNFEHSDEAFYQFRPKAFDLEGKSSETTSTTAPPTTKNLAPLASNFIKRSNTFVNVVAKALNANAQSEPAHIKARHEADEADRAYRIAIRRLDRKRLGVEEKIEETLKTLQSWEAERLRAVKIVLLQYQGTLANIPKALEATNDRSKTLIASYQPESDLKALIERYRTGPFHPTPQVYESLVHDEADVVFGIDLRKWSEGGWEALTSGGGEQKKGLVPDVLSALLGGVQEAYGRLPNDDEKRKAWIYEVPLAAVHHLREALNGVGPDLPVPPELLAQYDAPVLASAIKLWLLELDPPLALWDGWDEIRKLYPTVGSKANANPDAEASDEQHIQDLSAALQKLPRVHLYVLDVLIGHFKTLIDTTSVEEDDEVFLTKLALSAGRTIVRPKFETEITLNDRHPTLLFIDLVKNYDKIIPPTIAKKKRESERKIPLRKHTAPVDMRVVRGKISAGAPAREIYVAQQQQQQQQATQTAEVVPPLPPLPPDVKPTVPVTKGAAAESKPAAPPPPPSLVTPPPPPKLETPKVTSVPLVPPPPPPPILSPPSVPAPPPVPVPPQVPPPPPVIASPAVNLAETPRPQFKEPPPEDDDDVPPRPSFKEPPPEPEDDYLPPPRPHFVDPPVSPPATPPPPPPQPATEVIPPTPTPQNKPSPVPVKRNSLITQANNSSSSSVKRFSRSPSPPINLDKPLSSAASSISRSGSSQSGYTRGPRLSTSGGGPRPSVSSLVSNLNRNSIGGPPSSASPPSYKRMSGSPSRPVLSQDPRAKGIGRAQALSRRTMASDAEEEVVQ